MSLRLVGLFHFFWIDACILVLDVNIQDLYSLFCRACIERHAMMRLVKFAVANWRNFQVIPVKKSLLRITMDKLINSVVLFIKKGGYVFSWTQFGLINCFWMLNAYVMNTRLLKSVFTRYSNRRTVDKIWLQYLETQNMFARLKETAVAWHFFWKINLVPCQTSVDHNTKRRLTFSHCVLVYTICCLHL